MKTCLLSLISCLFLAACGGISAITPDQQAVMESRLPAIDSHGGQLCMLRAQNYKDMLIAMDVMADGEFIGRLPNNSWFCANLTPGEYAITTDARFGFRAGADVSVKRGERKFLELNVDSKDIITLHRAAALGGIWGNAE